MQGRRIRALVLAAGLGTRLRPLTEHTPKPLLPFQGKPILFHLFDHLIEEGVERLVVNTHHLAESLRQAAIRRRWRGGWVS